jgi:hypothetical protein
MRVCCKGLKQYTHKLHRRNFTRSREMWLSRVGIRNLGDDFLPIIRTEQQYSVIHTIGVLPDADAAICLCDIRCLLCKLSNAESTMAL